MDMGTARDRDVHLAEHRRPTWHLCRRLRPATVCAWNFELASACLREIASEVWNSLCLDFGSWDFSRCVDLYQSSWRDVSGSVSARGGHECHHPVYSVHIHLRCSLEIRAKDTCIVRLGCLRNRDHFLVYSDG